MNSKLRLMESAISCKRPKRWKHRVVLEEQKDSRPHLVLDALISTPTEAEMCVSNPNRGLYADLLSCQMDDSGFFSSQVMDEALKPFSLQLVRWRSERMRPLHSAPE
jgi:hypothetical protein